MSKDDSHLNILLHIQEQLGNISRETGEQTQKLIAIEAQVKKTNGRVSALEGINIQTEKDKAYEKGKLTMLGILAGGLGTLAMSFISKIISKF